MRILQICSKVPYPAKDGGCLAMLNLAEMMHKLDIEVKILAMETYKHPSPKNGYPQQFKNTYAPETIFIDTKPHLWRAAVNLFFSKESYHLARFKSNTFHEKLLDILIKCKPDIVVLDSLFSAGYIDLIRANSNCKIIYRAHNIEHIIWQEIAAKTKSSFKKIYLTIQSERLQKEEMHAIEKCDGVLAITNKDANFFSKHYPSKKLMILPFTVDLNAYQNSNKYHEKALFFIGAMDWYPNLEGVKWFIDMVWNEVLKTHPSAKFYLAGKAMPETLKNIEEKNIINLGEVPDAKEFMKVAPIMIAPIFSGGGLKIKIVEAMAMAKIVICNPQAASGIPITDRKDVLLANSSIEFIDTINKSFNNLPQLATIGENARLLIEEHFSSVGKANELSSFFNSIK